MQISVPNDNGVLEPTQHEELARMGRFFATVNFAMSDDGLIRYSLHLMHSYGGFGGPIRIDSQGYATLNAARMAALDELLRQWPKAWPSEPTSVHHELQLMREQVESHLRQPSLF